MSDPNDPIQEEAQKRAELEKAERDKLDREKMAAFGWDPDNPALFDAYQKNQDKVATEQMTQQDAFRDMRARDYEEADKQRRDEAKQEKPQTPDLLPGDDPEAKKLAYSKEQEAEVEAGRIDDREKVYRERRFDNQLTMAEKAPENNPRAEVPQPRQETPQQRPVDASDDQKQEQQQSKQQPLDWERMMSDPDYRKQMEQQTREERAQRLEQMQQERGGGVQRAGAGGRER